MLSQPEDATGQPMPDRRTRPARQRRATIRRPVEPRVDELPGGKYLWGDGDLELIKVGKDEEPAAPHPKRRRDPR